MQRLALAVILTFTISGCASLGAEGTTASRHVADFDAAAKGYLETPQFVGLAGFDGHIDLERFEKAVKEELEEEGADGSILDDFDLRYRNGVHGDGASGTWFAAYVDIQAEQALLLQATPDGMNHRIFTEDDLDADMAPKTALDTVLSLLGTPGTSTKSDCDEDDLSRWPETFIDSDEAAAIAMTDATFLNHTQEFPEGDYVYVLTPEWTWCWGGETGTEPAMWAVAHVDVDALLDEDWDNGTLAYAIMDAASGELLDSGVEGDGRYVELYGRFEVTGGLLPAALSEPAYGSYIVHVEEGYTHLDMWLWATGGGADFTVTDPSGMVHAHDMELGEGDLVYWIESPLPGDWLIEAGYDHIIPNDSRDATIEAYLYS